MTTGSLINNILPDAQAFEVGDGATICHWTDRTACTVIGVSPSGKTVTLQADRAIRTDKNGMSDAQTYRYERDPEGHVRKARLLGTSRARRAGWYSGGERVVPGRRAHHDFSF